MFEYRGIADVCKKCCNLRGLNLSGIPVDDAEFRMKIWEILSTMKLTYLSIGILFFIRPQIEDDAYKEQFYILFKRCTTLQALELYCNCRTTRRDYEVQCYFPSLRYCRLNFVQNPMCTCVQSILTTCKNLSCFSCHCSVQLQLSLSSIRSNNLPNSFASYLKTMMLMISLWTQYQLMVNSYMYSSKFTH